MPRSVDNIDLVILVLDRAVLGIDGNASFPFEVVAVHDAVHNLLVILEDMALLQECIYKRRFSGIDMCDHRNVDNLLIIHIHSSSKRSLLYDARFFSAIRNLSAMRSAGIPMLQGNNHCNRQHQHRHNPRQLRKDPFLGK